MSEMKEIDKTPKVNKRFHWKGKLVTERVYNLRCRQQNSGKNLRSIYGTKNAAKAVANLKSDVNTKDPPLLRSTLRSTGSQVNAKFVEIEGYRIVNLKTFRNEMFCRKCKSILSLSNITKEKRSGLTSMFYVECQQCHVITRVCTDKQGDASQQNPCFDTNTETLVGEYIWNRWNRS